MRMILLRKHDKNKDVSHPVIVETKFISKIMGSTIVLLLANKEPARQSTLNVSITRHVWC